MKNAEWLVKKGINFRALDVNWADPMYEHHDTRIFISVPQEPKSILYKCRAEYDDIYEGLLEWLDAEYIEPLLDDTEKRYLESILRPWKHDRNISITKLNNDVGEYLSFGVSNDVFTLPYFKAGKMYKGLQAERRYTTKDLGLWEDEK